MIGDVQWRAMDGDDQRLLVFVLSSLMVAEERIATKFSALAGLTRRLDIVGVPLSTL